MKKREEVFAARGQDAPTYHGDLPAGNDGLGLGLLGISAEDVVDSLKSLAVSRNMFFVGESPFYKQIKAITGEDYRYVNFLSFCDARTGKKMLEYRNALAGFMPCRIALVEHADGRLWLYSMNLDLMIYGGTRLPAELRDDAIRVRDTLREMMQMAAAGEF